MSEIEMHIRSALRQVFPKSMRYEELVPKVNEIAKRETGAEWNPEYICRQTRRMKKKGMVEGNGERGFRLSFSKKKYRTMDTLVKEVKD